MNFKERNKETNFSIDIAPLVDVVFLLLIFFMLSTTFEIKPGLKVDLPEGTTKEIKTEQKDLKIYITKKEEIYFNGKKVSLDTLKNELSKIQNKKKLIIIEADKFSYHGVVVSVMDVAKSLGFNNFAIATKVKRSEK